MESVKRNSNQAFQNNRLERSSADERCALSGHQSRHTQHRATTSVKVIEADRLRDASYTDKKTNYVPQPRSETKSTPQIRHSEWRKHHDSSIATDRQT